MTEARVPVTDDALVEVTPEDRAAWAAHWVRKGFPKQETAEKIIAGWADDAPLLQMLARHRLAGVAAGREEAQAEITMLRGHLTTIIGRMGKGDRDAPGHSHDKPGIWDDDNKPGVAGTKCQWCAEWKAARAAIRERGE